MQLTDLLQQALDCNASDVLVVAGMPPAYKADGEILREGEMLKHQDTKLLVEELYNMARRPIDRLIEYGDDDFSFAVPGMARFRVNALKQRGSLGMVLRVVRFQTPDYKELGIPDEVMQFADCKRGLVLITGSAGSGKSTTLACIVDRINTTRNAHIVTIEDPIEYLHQHKKSVVTQRELITDTRSYDTALRAALREAPDVILLGEMRDAETIRAAATAAETGHLIISTLHTIGAANTIDRIIDTFPPAQQSQIRVQVSMALTGIVSQQLLRTTNGKQTPAFEVMRATPAVCNLIRESKTYQLDNVIGQSTAAGMNTMDNSILKLVQQGRVSKEEAMLHCLHPEWMEKRLAAIPR